MKIVTKFYSEIHKATDSLKNTLTNSIDKDKDIIVDLTKEEEFAVKNMKNDNAAGSGIITGQVFNYVRRNTCKILANSYKNVKDQDTYCTNGIVVRYYSSTRKAIKKPLEFAGQ